MLAINQDQPKTALDILSDMDKNLTSVIVRIIALSDLGEFDLVEQIMRNTLVHMGKSNQRFSWYTVSCIIRSIELSLIENLYANFILADTLLDSTNSKKH